ncbi:MAG: glucosylceramidase [Acidimicrobiaceae bacterium]|nr:glucosylceramidase [Acidimicrobiaceae bacterium]
MSPTPHATAATAQDKPPSAPARTIPRRTADEVRSVAITFRKKFGLAFDDAALAAADANPAAGAQSRYGVSLTPAEFADQVTRDGWAEAKGPMMEALNQRRDEFAGMWIDQAKGGAFVVMAMPTASPVGKAAVVAAAPAGAPVTFASADFSSATLDGAYGVLNGVHVDSTAATPKAGNPLVALRARGFDVLVTGVETQANRIVVGVKGLTTERLGELESVWDGYAAAGTLPARALVQFTRIGGLTPQESRYESPVVMKGGLELIGNDGTRQGQCTSNVSASGGVVLTASHCYGPGTHVSHANQEVAFGLAYDGYFNGSTADVEALPLRVPRMASRFMFNAFGCNGNLDTCQQIDAATTVHSGNYVGGERVCTGGATTYWIDCGTVQIASAAGTQAGPRAWRGVNTFNDQVVADYHANPGTSGGVVGVGGVVHGIHSAVVDDPQCLTCQTGAQQSTSAQSGAITQPQPGWAFFSRMVRAQTNMNRSVVTGRTWVGITSAFAGGKCADVQNNVTNNGTPVWSWPCDGGTAQRWSLEPYGTSTVEPNLWWTLKRFDVLSKCMDIDINLADGARVQEWDCNAQSQQTFRFDKYGYDWSSGGSDPSTFRVISMRTDRCVDLDIAAGGQQNGAKIQQWTCLGATQRNQYWRSY